MSAVTVTPVERAELQRFEEIMGIEFTNALSSKPWHGGKRGGALLGIGIGLRLSFIDEIVINAAGAGPVGGKSTMRMGVGEAGAIWCELETYLPLMDPADLARLETRILDAVEERVVLYKLTADWTP